MKKFEVGDSLSDIADSMIWKQQFPGVVFAYSISEVEDIVRARLKDLDYSLTTAEMYVAAVLSGDKKLQAIFQSDTGDFHAAVAHMVFHLPCEVHEVKKLYPKVRQAAKAVSFGINS